MPYRRYLPTLRYQQQLLQLNFKILFARKRNIILTNPPQYPYFLSVVRHLTPNLKCHRFRYGCNNLGLGTLSFSIGFTLGSIVDPEWLSKDQNPDPAFLFVLEPDVEPTQKLNQVRVKVVGTVPY
jgi:hypothetical protein